jgi:DNA replication protein DnaC
MPRALEVLDQTVRQLERGESSALEMIDTPFAEELTLRENRRVKMALRMAKLSTIKTLAGFDFSFQPSLDRNRILALAQLDFIERKEVIHFLGPPGTGKSHLATALGVEAAKAGRSVSLQASLTLSAPSQRPNGRANYASAFAFCAEPHC